MPVFVTTQQVNGRIEAEKALAVGISEKAKEFSAKGVEIYRDNFTKAGIENITEFKGVFISCFSNSNE